MCLFLSETFLLDTVDEAVKRSVMNVTGYIGGLSLKTESSRSFKKILRMLVNILPQNESAIYSASPEDGAATVCFFVVHIIGDSFTWTKSPVVD